MADIEGRRYALRVQGLPTNPDFLGELPIADAQGRLVPLSSLAELRLGMAPPRELVRLDGRAAVLLSVTKSENVNTLELTRAVRDLVAEKKPEARAIEPVHAEARQGDVRHSLADIGLARERLGYAPLFSVRDGLGRAADWYVNSLG